MFTAARRGKADVRGRPSGGGTPQHDGRTATTEKIDLGQRSGPGGFSVGN